MKHIDLPSKKNWSQEIKHFESIDLHDVYGDEFVAHRTFDSNLAERICIDLFGWLSKTEHPHLFRGDFVYDNFFKETYYDHKTSRVVKKLKDGKRGPFYYVKYSNVGSKLFVQIVFKELDLIIKDFGELDLVNNARLIAIRYKGEMTFDDMDYIDEIIDDIRKYRRGDSESFCVRNQVDFLNFVNSLAAHNVRRHSNLILFHEPTTWEQLKKWDIRVEENCTKYKTYHKQTNYMVTPIDVNKVNIYVDYIGYGGFKVNISTTELPNDDCIIIKPLDGMEKHIDELNDAIDVISGISYYKGKYGVLPWNDTDYFHSDDKTFYECMGREVPVKVQSNNINL